MHPASTALADGLHGTIPREDHADVVITSSNNVAAVQNAGTQASSGSVGTTRKARFYSFDCILRAPRSAIDTVSTHAHTTFAQWCTKRAAVRIEDNSWSAASASSSSLARPLLKYVIYSVQVLAVSDRTIHLQDACAERASVSQVRAPMDTVGAMNSLCVPVANVSKVTKVASSGDTGIGNVYSDVCDVQLQGYVDVGNARHSCNYLRKLLLYAPWPTATVRELSVRALVNGTRPAHFVPLTRELAAQPNVYVHGTLAHGNSGPRDRGASTEESVTFATLEPALARAVHSAVDDAVHTALAALRADLTTVCAAQAQLTRDVTNLWSELDCDIAAAPSASPVYGASSCTASEAESDAECAHDAASGSAMQPIVRARRLYALETRLTHLDAVLDRMQTHIATAPHLVMDAPPRGRLINRSADALGVPHRSERNATTVRRTNRAEADRDHTAWDDTGLNDDELALQTYLARKKRKLPA